MVFLVANFLNMAKHPRRRFPCPFPIKCAPCDHSVNLTEGLLNPSVTSNPETPSPVAIDCEMVGVGPKLLSALGRVSIVDYFGEVLYDVMVRPEKEITDYRTPWSGIREADMRRAIPFTCAQDQVQRIIQGRIVVGHMLHGDFEVLCLKHPRHLVRDTGKAPYAKILAFFPSKPAISLRALTLRLFGVNIQTGEHCSTEDARAAMAIYRLVEHVWEEDLLKAGKQNNLTDEVFSKVTVSSISNSSALSDESIIIDPQLDNSTVTDEDDSNVTNNIKRSSIEIIQPSIVKRRCQGFPKSLNTLQFDESNSSLLDDGYWPDG